MSRVRASLGSSTGSAIQTATGYAERLQCMCHHGLITEDQASEVIERVQNGDQTVEDAIEELQESCPCGFFIPSRARRILKSASNEPAP